MIILFGVLLIQCNNSRKTEINAIIKEIELHNIFEGKNSGIIGQNSIQYKRFERLIEIANIEDLIKIFDNHPSSIIRLYTYYAIKIKNEELSLDIKDILIKDFSEFLYLDGCVGVIYKINDFIIINNSI